MTKKQKCKMLADMAMTLLMPLLMAYNLLGEALHEWIGMAMFALFILHHCLNIGVTSSLCRGQITPYRLFLMALDLLLFIDMLCLMVSAVLMSGHVFAFLHITAAAAQARILHMLGAYWGFALMSFHLGVHAKQLTARFRARLSHPACAAVCRCLVLAVSLRGLYAFAAQKWYAYMLLQQQFVFLDFSRSLIAVLLDYLAIMVFFAGIGYLASAWVLHAMRPRTGA